MNRNTDSHLLTCIQILLGNLLLALSVKLFLLPSGLISGGSTGLALTVNRMTGISVSTFVLVFNWLMIAAGFLFLGKKLVANTLLSSAAYPLFLKLLERLLADTVFPGGPLACSVLAGLGMGLANGLVIGAGASGGGIDIPVLVIHRYTKLPAALCMGTFDVVIVLSQAVSHSIPEILCGLCLILLNAVTMNAVLNLLAAWKNPGRKCRNSAVPENF